MRLGIGSFTFAWAIGVPGHPPRKPMDALDLLGAAERLGVGVVQVCDNLALAKLGADDLSEFEAKVRAANIEVELGTRGLDSANLRANLELAKRFGCSFLRLVVDSHSDEPSPAKAVQRLREILPEFERAGVKLAIENHDRFTCQTLAWMIEQLGPERAGICLDTVNSFGAMETPDAVVDALGAYVLCLHVKDFTIRRVDHQMGFVIEGCAAGKGRLNVPWLLEKLGGASQRFNAILETWLTPSASLEETIQRERAWAEEGIRYLRTLVKD